MNRKTTILVILSVTAIASMAVRPLSQSPIQSLEETQSPTVAPAPSVPPQIVAPAPARQIPATVAQSMQKALADRQDKLRQLGKTPSNAEKKQPGH